MINIEGNVYGLKYTIRALFVYERITGEPYVPNKLMNDYILLYSILLASNEHFDMQFDEFIDRCDKDPVIFTDFKKWFLDVLKKKAMLQGGENAQSSDDKKKD